MKLSLDRYVGRIVIGSWLSTLLFFVLLTVLLDLLNNLGKYLDRADDQGLGPAGLLWYLVGYYLELTPVSFVSLAPFVTTVACMFALARLLAANEVVPMLFAGRSMFRVLRPMLYMAAVSALAMAACWQWVLPQLREQLVANASMFAGTGAQNEGVVMVEQHEGRRKLLFASRYDHGRRTMQGLLLLEEGQLAGDATLLTAEQATWDAAAGDWRLSGGQLRHGAVTELDRELLGEPTITPDRVWKAGIENLDVDLLSYSDLLDMHRVRPNRGDITLALHRHMTFPLANLILLLLALPFAIHFERGARIERTLAAIGVCGAYLLVDLTCQNLGNQKYLHPIVAAWLPTILFGSLGVSLFSGVRT